MDLKFKCLHYDIARGAYLRPETFREAMHLAAKSGFTHFLPYLENMIRLPSMEKACPACAYTPEQWSDFDSTAAGYGIELIPHFNVIGHLEKFSASYSDLAGLANGTVIDFTLSTAKERILKCLEEFCSFSKGSHFLVGGDEWLPSNSMLKSSGFNAARLWIEFINSAVAVLKERGRIPIVWHDMLLHYPEALELLSKDAVIAFWFYDEDSDYPAIDMFQKMGFKTIMASGLCDGLLTGRRQKAIECAVRACEKYAPYGLMMTNWGDTDNRWERGSLGIPLAGKIIDKESVPDALIRAASITELLEKKSFPGEKNQELKDELGVLLTEDAWEDFPLCLEHFRNSLLNKKVEGIESYGKYHFEEGPLYLRLTAASKGNLESGHPARLQNIIACVAEEKTLGIQIKVTNGDESFYLYPEYGASLQGLMKGGAEIIPHSLPDFVGKHHFQPGGYRSYSGVGGFRPIWAFGSHHNPCILWQGPFEWDIREYENSVAILLSRKMYHVDVEYKIVASKGRSGFRVEAVAVNKIDGACGTFSFNLPLAIGSDELTEAEISSESKQIKLKDIRDSFFVFPPCAKLAVKKRNLTFSIESDIAKCSGFYTDWSSSYLTPDFRGVYKKLDKGETSKVTWDFSMETNLSASIKISAGADTALMTQRNMSL